MWSALRAAGIRVKPDTARRLAGGSINEAWAVDSDAGRLFVKFNAIARRDMFEAEAEGLTELGKAGLVRVPEVVAVGAANHNAFLALEFLDLERGTDAAARALGTGLAHLHSLPAPYFGWHRDNTIGSTPQINTRCGQWPAFFRRHRLGFQLELAERAGARELVQAGRRLMAGLDRFFADAPIEPALLHGDLWGGNWGVCAGQPVLFDPAVHYGDPEADIAMTTLFGGFPRAFFEAYRAVRPDRPGASERRELYRLYHVLNHFNLFGGGYAAQARQIVETLLAAS